MVEATTRIASHHLDQLRRSCGEVMTPADSGYDDARRLWNAIHDRRPAVVVRPTTATGVATAVQFAREHDLEIVVKSGGHSASGLTGADGCLLVDLSEMRGVEVNAETRIAWANGGAFLGELDVAAQEHGLVCPIGVIGPRASPGSRSAAASGRPPAAFRPHSTTWPSSSSSPRTAASFGRATKSEALLGPARCRLELRDRDRVRVPTPAVRARPAPGRLGLPGDPDPGRVDGLSRLRAKRPGRGVSHVRHRSSGTGRRLPGRDDRPADRVPRLEPQRLRHRRRARHGRAPRGPEADDDDDRERAVSRGPDRS